MCISLSLYIYIHTHTSAHAHAHIHTYPHSHIHVHIRMHTHMHTYTRIPSYTHIRTYMHAHIYTRTHTATHNPPHCIHIPCRDKLAAQGYINIFAGAYSRPHWALRYPFVRDCSKFAANVKGSCFHTHISDTPRTGV